MSQDLRSCRRRAAHENSPLERDIFVGFERGTPRLDKRVLASCFKRRHSVPRFPVIVLLARNQWTFCKGSDVATLRNLAQ